MGRTDQHSDDPIWRWALRVFLSLDMVGATALKHEHKGMWPRVFGNFYRDISERMAEDAAIHAAVIAGEDHQLPKLWEVPGDELIFMSDCRRLEHVAIAVNALLTTVATFNAQVAGSDTAWARPVRATAWSVGFPLTNRVYVVPPSGDEQREQYVGPEMDAGFRLTKAARPDLDLVFASPRLTWLLCQAESAGIAMYRWRYLGRLNLPGVNHGRPVPGFAIDNRTDPTDDDVLLGEKRAEADRTVIERVALTHCMGPDGTKIEPFILGDEHVSPSDSTLQFLNAQREKIRNPDDGLDDTSFDVGDGGERPPNEPQ